MLSMDRVRCSCVEVRTRAAYLQHCTGTLCNVTYDWGMGLPALVTLQCKVDVMGTYYI